MTRHALIEQPADMQVYFGACDWPAHLTGQHRPELRDLIRAGAIRDQVPAKRPATPDLFAIATAEMRGAV